MHSSTVFEGKSNKSTLNVINTQLNKSIKSVKIVDLIRTRSHAGERFYSIEVSHFGSLFLNFNDFIDQPLFTSVTWFSNDVEVENDTVEPAIQLIDAITSTATILHLTCYKMTEMTVKNLLDTNITNILALRGDIVAPDQMFQHAIDLIKCIKHTNRNVSLAVGGYPELHPESLTLELDMKYLREKVDAGADFIITQASFSSTNIIEFIKNCRAVGINVPIVPGIYVPPTFSKLKSMCRICNIKVPAELFRRYQLLKDDVKAFQDYAVDNTIELLNDLFQMAGDEVTGVHFFTLNSFELINSVTSKFDFK